MNFIKSNFVKLNVVMCCYIHHHTKTHTMNYKSSKMFVICINAVTCILSIKELLFDSAKRYKDF